MNPSTVVSSSGLCWRVRYHCLPCGLIRYSRIWDFWHAQSELFYNLCGAVAKYYMSKEPFTDITLHPVWPLPMSPILMDISISSLSTQYPLCNILFIPNSISTCIACTGHRLVHILLIPTLVQSAVNMALVLRRRVDRWNITVEASDQPVSQLVKYIGIQLSLQHWCPHHRQLTRLIWKWRAYVCWSSTR